MAPSARICVAVPTQVASSVRLPPTSRPSTGVTGTSQSVGEVGCSVQLEGLGAQQGVAEAVAREIAVVVVVPGQAGAVHRHEAGGVELGDQRRGVAEAHERAATLDERADVEIVDDALRAVAAARAEDGRYVFVVERGLQQVPPLVVVRREDPMLARARPLVRLQPPAPEQRQSGRHTLGPGRASRRDDRDPVAGDERARPRHLARAPHTRHGAHARTGETSSVRSAQV